MHSVLNLAEQKIANINVGIAVTDEYAEENADVVEGFLAAIKKGIEREKADEAYSLELLEEAPRRDRRGRPPGDLGLLRRRRAARRTHAGGRPARVGSVRAAGFRRRPRGP